MNGTIATVSTTVSGYEVDLLAPSWRDVDLSDVARGLSQINRFCGQTRRPFSVAEHSIVVGDLVPPHLKLAALLHDAHEALIGDVPTPAVRALEVLVGPRLSWAIARLKHGLDLAIARAVIEALAAQGDAPTADLAAEILANEMHEPAIRDADREALRLEDAIRKTDSLQHSGSELISRAAKFYGPVAPDCGVIASDWQRRVEYAALARSAKGGME